ncbi:glycoside hydrolase family 37 protein [Cucurbitaria berberidis CBS 394.84]|uniref:Trehalase n=1 Tax=Cucurbitaria berberidis CBS 394.84 TaxID=1168544 RepID=A0A9P4GD90_9PLEO|nr:glycoside hydrolase family 37 protein [Cucurbitaria berberidis CBS 394.84]KAF1843497.1 glycoside hydrolase family 37 protein [Cucurbitaria berberidis CBS 394.84]
MRSWTAALIAGAPLASALFINGSVIAPCDSPIYCYGDLLREVELARPFEDSKTFVDLPTTRPLNEVLAAFANLSRPIENNTALNNFLSTYFGKAGSELEEVPAEELKTQPDFLENVNSSVVEDFTRQVIDIWPDLTRRYVGAGNCSGCVNSFIPVNRTFVVAGGRFREPYYWDSFWVIEGLLRTQGSFTQIAENIIENFLDLVEDIGFVPNGARRYYENRSQPPLLTQMVRVYVEYTQNYTLLERALPILELEYEFWVNNRTVTLERAGRNYSLNHYEVQNTQPRPESYYEDYVTANNETYFNKEGKQFNATQPLNETEKATLYSNLASGAESGWDYSARWIANPSDAVTDTFFPLRSLNTIEIIPVELNSILYYNEITIAEFYRREGNYTAARKWAGRAKNRSEAMTTLLWSAEHYSYFDYNLTSSSQNIYTLADNTSTPLSLSGAPPGKQIWFQITQFYPFWTGAAPDSIKNDPKAMRRVFARVEELLANGDGAIAATNLATGQQWDEPNVWPPLQYILMKGLLNTPLEVNEEDDEETTEDYVWTQDLALRLAQRYLDSLYCTWRVTGGATEEVPQLPNAEGNGTIFEKYSDASTNARGGGGEYEVVEGFGWSNGVLIWAVDQFGQRLTTPECGNITAANLGGGGAKRKRSAVELSKRDASWIKKTKRSSQWKY